jgi:hypothetical protein
MKLIFEYPPCGSDMQPGRYFCLGFLALTLFWLTGCEFIQPLVTKTPTPTATFTPAPVPTVTPTPQDSGEWQSLLPGLERRTLEIEKDGVYLESLFILRLEPDEFRFGVTYDPQGLTLEEWQAQTGALIVINGGYFRLEGDDYIPNGLTVIDGVALGESYGAFGGMLAVSENGPELRWLAQQPYDLNEPLQAALQSFPILVKPGGQLGFPAEHEDHISARRTVIARDMAGRILLMVAPQGNLSLHQLSDFLSTADLEIDIAINLDGGPSSGILLSDPLIEIPALAPLPVVITMHER